MPADKQGTVYLLCFPGGLHVTGNRYARHYLGWTGNGVQQRLAEHLSGRGSPLVRAAVASGLSVELVRTWEDATRTFERQIKRQRNLPQYCPLCNVTSRRPGRLVDSEVSQRLQVAEQDDIASPGELLAAAIARPNHSIDPSGRTEKESPGTCSHNPNKEHSMMILTPTLVAMSRFIFDRAENTLTAVASDLGLGHELSFERVYDDACDVGLTVIGSTQEIVFAVTHEERRDGDLLYWDLTIARPQSNTGHLGNITVRIYND